MLQTGEKYTKNFFMKRGASYFSLEKNILDYGRHLGGDYLIRLHAEKEEDVRQRSEKRKQYEVLSLIEQAKEEWKFSLTLLAEMTDPDLIDYVTYRVKSNEARYRYLLKLARQEKISDPIWQE